MGGKHHRRTGRHLMQFLYKNGTFVGKFINDSLVMHNLVTHIDRRTKLVEGCLDDFDGPVNTGAKAARRGESKMFCCFSHAIVHAR